MTKNPFYNAGIAIAYIVFIVTIINVGSKWAGPEPDNTFLMPVGMLSLFVTSAAFMGFTFFYQPVTMYWDGKRKEALKLFLQTVSIFAVITFAVLLTALLVF